MGDREAEVRGFTRALLARLGVSPSPVAVARYARIAARWEHLRLRLDRGVPTPGDDARFVTLSAALRNQAADLAVPTCAGGGDAVAGVTDRRGFLPGDPARLLTGETWRTAAATAPITTPVTAI